MKLLSAIKYLLVILLFSGIGCDEIIIDQTFTVGKESTFRLNQLYTSTDGQYTLLIKEIGDSRCPEGVVCKWQGEVSLKGEWTDNKNLSSIELHSVIKDLQKEPNGFTIQIIDAQPYPKYGNDPKPGDLAVTLLIQKK